tara:strand:- start:184 stop:381 length:198 start_codon:yes stop_codon:yes gene_type:complete
MKKLQLNGYMRLWVVASAVFWIGAIAQVTYGDYKKALSYVLFTGVLYLYRLGIEWVVKGFKNEKK